MVVVFFGFLLGIGKTEKMRGHAYMCVVVSDERKREGRRGRNLFQLALAFFFFCFVCLFSFVFLSILITTLSNCVRLFFRFSQMRQFASSSSFVFFLSGLASHLQAHTKLENQFSSSLHYYGYFEAIQ